MPLSLQRLNYARAVAEGSEAQMYERMLEALDKDGAVIVEQALSYEEADCIASEMRPFLEATARHNGGFPTDHDTRRCGALVARSPTSHRAILHPLMVAVCKGVLGEQRLTGRRVRNMGRPAGEGRYPWRLSLTQIIDVGPGSLKQAVHRGNGLWGHDFGMGMDPQVETMWALSYFTEDNGATHVLPGSHRWPVGHGNPEEAPSVQAVMPKGSVLIWTGWTLHGAGVNRTTQRRMGLNIDYVLSFLQTEENQFLACPPHVAKALPDAMKRMLGYTLNSVYGYFADVLPPDAALREDVDVCKPGSHQVQSMKLLEPPSKL